MVILNYYEGNDLRDALVYQNYRHRGADSATKGMKPTGVIDKIKQSAQHVFDTPIVGKSYALNLALAFGIEFYVATKNLWGMDEQSNFRYAFEFSDARIAFNLENTDIDEIEHARALREGKISLTVLDEGLARFVELAKRHGFEPVVWYTPSAYTAYSEYVAFEDPELAQLMPWFSRAQRDFLRSKSQALGYRFVDLTPALQQTAREYGAEDLLYFPTNVHLSQLGNEVVARALAEVLASDAPPRPSAARSSGQSS
jgi:hypothetical protein